MPAPTVTVDHVRDPADRCDGSALIPCPEKGGDQIAAGRCVATTDCPRAKSCPFRPAARKAVEAAAAATVVLFGGLRPCPGGCGHSTRARLCWRCTLRAIVKRCAWCDREFSPTRKGSASTSTCSLSCRASWREYRKRPKGKALGPEVSITARGRRRSA